jgi:hypothetical protein
MYLCDTPAQSAMDKAFVRFNQILINLLMVLWLFIANLPPMKKLIFLVLLAGVGSSQSQSIVRGPYLQVLTETTVEVCWRTDVPTDSRVIYGLGLSGQSLATTDATPKTEHRITLTGLTPGTKYYYSVGNAGTIFSGQHENHRFRTMPTNGEVGATRIWAIGDFGKNNQGQRDVMNSYLSYTDTVNTDLWIWLGDNAYDDGTDQEYQDKVFNVYDSILPFMPVFSTPGNHDYNSVNRLDPPDQHVGPYFDIIASPILGQAGGVPSNTELYYSFDYRNIHIISLNSEIQAWTSNSSSAMYTWLQQDLQANTKEWVIVYFHQPPYTKGSHDSDDFWEIFMISMRQNALPILEDHGVDLVLCGHSHVYERSMLIKDHYSFSFLFNSGNIVDGSSGKFALGEHYEKYLNGSNEGTVYVVCGNGGSSENGADLDHPVMIAGDDTYGSLVIDVNGNRLDCKYLRSDGVIHDEFTIIKPDGSDPVFASVNENTAAIKASVFPNPAVDMVTLSVDVKTGGDVVVDLVDAAGKKLSSRKATLNAGLNKLDVAVAHLAAGNYRLNIRGKELQHSVPFTRQ